MAETPLSLLDRLVRDPNPESWRRLIDIYMPLVRGWLHQVHVRSSDLDDLLQEILAVLVREVPHFRHNQRRGAFRRWLRVMTMHRLKHYWRVNHSRAQASNDAQQLDQLADPASDLSRRWDEEHDRHIL